MNDFERYTEIKEKLNTLASKHRKLVEKLEEATNDVEKLPSLILEKEKDLQNLIGKLNVASEKIQSLPIEIDEVNIEIELANEKYVKIEAQYDKVKDDPASQATQNAKG